MGNNIFNSFPSFISDIIKARDGSVTDINIQPNKAVWAKFYGVYRHIGFLDFDIEFALHKIATESNGVLNSTNPILSTMYDGLRLEIQIPPITVAPSVSIRIPIKKEVSLEQYLQDKTITNEEYEVILKAIIEDCNILVCGATGSGKTTFMTGLYKKQAEIHPNKNNIIIEDTDELVCYSPLHKKYLTAAKIGITKKHLLKSAMRSDPDSIGVGELRDFNTYYYLQAGNTGHKGCFTSLHCNSVESAPLRLEDLCLENPELKNRPYRLIEEAVDIVIHMELYTDKDNQVKRRISQIGRLKEYDIKKDKYIFEFLTSNKKENEDEAKI